MNLGQVARILAKFTLFFSLIQVIPLVLAYTLEEGPQNGIDARTGFGMSIGIGIATSLLLYISGRQAPDQFFRKESLVVVGAAWLFAGVLGAIPFLSSGTMIHAADAVFESISGLTTTGASVLGSDDTRRISELPPSMLFWRSMLQWIGGLGIIMVFVVLLPAMGVTGKNLLSSEQVGVSNESLRPRMREQARSLFKVYVVLTVLAAATYWGITGEGFDSLCHAFTTMSSGGFSTKDASIGHYESAPMELATILFMFLAGCNFTLLLASMRQGTTDPFGIFKNPEFRLYAAVTVGLTLVCALSLWGVGQAPEDASYGSFGESLRHAAFAVVSILTSTGFGTEDFQTWPALPLLILMFCMFVGGCSGSTAGGFKMVRLLVVHKVMAYNLRHFIRPKSVEKIRVGHAVVSNPIIAAILAMLILWMGSVAVGTLALSLDPRLHIFDCFTMNLSMFGCTGPAITAVHQLGEHWSPINAGGIDVGPAGSYGLLYAWQKLLLSLQMVLGRLELLVPLALLSPGFWRK